MKNKLLSRMVWDTSQLIRKSTTSLKALTFLLVMVMSSNLMAAITSPWSHTFASGDITTSAQTSKKLDDISWAIDAAAYVGSDATKGVQLGSGNKPQKSDWTMSTPISSFGENVKITSVSISISTASSGGITYKIEVGDQSKTESLGATTSVTEKALNNISVSSGDIKITLNSNDKSKAIYIKSIKVIFEENSSSKTLESIAISGTPKTTYEAGEEFDYSGLVVTGTYSEGDPEAITSGITWEVTPSGALTVGTTSVKVKATVDGKSDSKNYTVSVTEHVITPGTYEIVPNTTFFNVNEQTTGKHDPVSGQQNDITLNHSGGSSFYCNSTQTRFYSGNTLQISVPTGYNISAISFTADGSNWTTDATKISANVGTMTDVKNWSGSANSVTITFGGACRCTKITVTYAAPIKKSVTISTIDAATLKVNDQTGTISDVLKGTSMTLSYVQTEEQQHAYRFSAWDVTTEDGAVTVTDNTFEMPAKDVTVSATFVPLYAVSVTTAGEGSGTATINGGTETIYVSEDDEITLVAEAAAGSEFVSWSATGTIVFDGETDAITTALAETAGTITATFNKKQCTILGTPQNVQVTDKTYSGAKLTWDAVANADYYEVHIKKGAEEKESDMVEGTEYTITSTLLANTEYSYSIIATSDDDDTYCNSNPAEGNFTTADYPTVVLTLSENGSTSTKDGKLNTPITLPTTSTQACDGKVFMGWSENAIEGEAAAATLLDATYTFDNPSVLEKTIYAVYAKAISGESQKYTLDYTTDVSSKTLGYGSAVDVTASDGSKWVVKASKQQGMQINAGKNASIKIPTCPRNITSIEVVGTAEKAVGLSAEDYTGSGTITYIAFGTDAKEQTIDLTNKSVTSGYIVGKSGANPITKIVVNYEGESTYSNYCTTCQAAVAAPTFSLEGGNYSEAKTLTLTATEGAIYYTINGGTETLYEEEIVLDNRGTFEISAYAKVDDRTSETVTKTYTLDWAYTLAELVDEGAPTTTGRTVTVILTNEIIESFATSGSYVNGFFTMVGDKKIEVYCQNSPAEWEVGGKVSGTVTCPWKDYKGTWELCPTDWDWASYTAPAKITSLVIDGDVTNKNYTAGQKLDFTDLTVTGVYDDNTEQNPHTEDVTADVVWTEVTLTENQVEAIAKATLNNAKTGNVSVTESKTITGLTVGAAKTLESIYVAEDSEHKKTFFVGRPFSAEGLKVMAHYNMDDDQQIALANLTITNTTFSEAEAEHTINISYTENDVTKETSYNVEVKYMNLNDLVAATDINDHDHVYVKFENVMITELVSKGILLNVQKGDKDIEIYNQFANCPNTWEQYGTVSATLDNVEWTNYQGTWEFKISNWDVVEYAAPNIPVTSMEISPAEVSVGEAKTTTLSIVYTPEHATNTGVTWAVAEGSEEFASVDAEGVVTGLKAGTATITATLNADPTITATRTVTVTETAKCEISYYVKGEVASTQEIAREEEGTLTYVPTLTVAGYTFAGWAEAAIAEETATAALISTYTPAADEATKNVYAIFKRVDDSSPTYQQYAKVTSALTDWAGDYLIAYSDEIFANGKVGGTEGGIGAANTSVSPSTALSGNVVTKEWGDQYKVTLEEISAGNNTYVLKTQDGKYNYQTSNANGLSATITKSTAAAYPISVTFTSENDVKLALGGNAAGAVFRYNSSGAMFRYYKNGGQSAVYLYKYDAGSALYTSYPVAKVKVTFNLDGGVGGCGTITINKGDDVILCGDAPTKDLYKFDAWSDGVNEYAADATIENVTEDIELTALWIAKKQYTISFNKAGAAGTTPASITEYEYNEVTLPAQGDLSNPGYIFGGWNDGETTHAGGATFTMPEKNVSMTAVWVAKTNDKWYLVTSADQLAAGKQYAIVANDKEAAMGAMVSDKTYMANVSASFNADKSMMIAIDPSAVILTLGGNATDGWTLSNNNQFLGSETNKNMKWSATADDYCKWAITIADAEDDYAADIFMSETIGSLLYNSNNNSQRFTTYASDMTAVQLYVLVPAQAINEETNASDLQDHADVTVNEGGNLVINENVELGDIVVEVGGKVTVEATTTLTVNNFVIKSSMGSGKSGQVIGVTEENFVVEGEAYYDVVLGDNGNPDKWHAFAVPFNVDAINGIYDLDDNKLTNEVNYAIMVYQGAVRAEGKYGWIKIQKTSNTILAPGTFYLMTVDGERTTYRMKMNGGFQVSSNTISVQQYAQSGAGTKFDAGWNGIANNQLGYSSVGVDVQVLNPMSYTFETMTASSTNFTVGTPFFYQADNATTEITLDAANGENPAYAPRRVGAAEVKNVDVRLANDRYTDHLYLSATDEATNEYQIGRDLVKMTMTNTPAVPQIFAEAYGNKLCMVDAPMMNDEATYALSLYAPANGEYTMSAEQVEDCELFLTKNGVVMWNLSMSDATIDLKKGNNAGYGIVMRKVAQVTTDNEAIRQDDATVQKFIYDDKLFIIRGGKTFDATGKFVK